MADVSPPSRLLGRDKEIWHIFWLKCIFVHLGVTVRKQPPVPLGCTLHAVIICTDEVLPHQSVMLIGSQTQRVGQPKRAVSQDAVKTTVIKALAKRKQLVVRQCLLKRYCYIAPCTSAIRYSLHHIIRL